jgi:hypothetical protein
MNDVGFSWAPRHHRPFRIVSLRQRKANDLPAITEPDHGSEAEVPRLVRKREGGRRPQQAHLKKAPVSVAPNPTRTTVDHARNALADLVAGREELERFLERLFGELERLGGQLDQRQRAMVAQRQEIERELRRQSEELERQRAAMEEQKQRVHEQVRREVAEITAGLAEAMVEQRRQMTEERTRWIEELTRLRQIMELHAQREMKTIAK